MFRNPRDDNSKKYLYLCGYIISLELIECFPTGCFFTLTLCTSSVFWDPFRHIFTTIVLYENIFVKESIHLLKLYISQKQYCFPRRIFITLCVERTLCSQQYSACSHSLGLKGIFRFYISVN